MSLSSRSTPPCVMPSSSIFICRAWPRPTTVRPRSRTCSSVPPWRCCLLLKLPAAVVSRSHDSRGPELPLLPAAAPRQVPPRRLTKHRESASSLVLEAAALEAAALEAGRTRCAAAVGCASGVGWLFPITRTENFSPEFFTPSGASRLVCRFSLNGSTEAGAAVLGQTALLLLLERRVPLRNDTQRDVLGIARSSSTERLGRALETTRGPQRRGAAFQFRKRQSSEVHFARA